MYMSSVELRECGLVSQLYVGEGEDDDGEEEEEGPVDGAPGLADRLRSHHSVALGGACTIYRLILTTPSHPRKL